MYLYKIGWWNHEGVVDEIWQNDKKYTQEEFEGLVIDIMLMLNKKYNSSCARSYARVDVLIDGALSILRKDYGFRKLECDTVFLPFGDREPTEKMSLIWKCKVDDKISEAFRRSE